MKKQDFNLYILLNYIAVDMIHKGWWYDSLGKFSPEVSVESQIK